VWLYAGVGIVEGSVPQKEWDETALKFRPMLDALGIRDKVHV
jgi:isochorismate synthase EntC